jgi:hypothetical protein
LGKSTFYKEIGGHLLSNELKFKPTDIQKKISNHEDKADYSKVSEEEMDYMMKCAMKYQQLHEAWHDGVKNHEPTIFYLRKSKEVIEDFEIPKRKRMT